MLAADGADANAPERENPGLHRGLAHEFDDLAHVDPVVEIGGILDREMRHVRPPNSLSFRTTSGEVTADRSVWSIIGLNRVALAGLDRADERSRQHHLAGLERQPERSDLVGEPGHG